ncbi:MAG: MFS transporter [Proteobacteria bacterium]|nr:MFS transporter [Pseudomonadota bacterium]
MINQPFSLIDSRFTAILAATLAQSLGAWGMFVYTAGASAIATDLGISATYIGYQIGLAYFAATLCTLISGSITRRKGAVQVLALAMALLAVGASVTTLWQLVGMFIGSVIMGIGFGLIPASTSQLLIAVTEENKRALIFSIKQAGIPIGGVMSALTTPYFAEVWGWRAAGYAVSLSCLGIFLFLILNRQRWVVEEHTNAPISLNPLLPLLAVRSTRRLRALVNMSLFYVGIQIVWMTFLSPFFVEDLKLSLVEAGYFLAIAQFTGIAGRIFWGWLSDRLQDNFTAMVLLGWVMTACCGAAYFLSADTSFVLLALLCFLIGFSAISWNGVFHAALIEVSPPGETVQVVAGMAFYVYIAMFVWPSLFALLIEWSGSYSIPIASLVLVTLAGVNFAWQAKTRR